MKTTPINDIAPPAPEKAEPKKFVGVLLLLFLIVLIGGVLRFTNLTVRGFGGFDQAAYTNLSKSPAYIVHWLIDHRREIKASLDKKTVPPSPPSIGMQIPFGVKPGHLIMLAAALMLGGVHDYVALGLSALFGLLSIPLMFLLGLKIKDQTTGLLAAAMLAVSWNHVFFSREGYPQTEIIFFLLAAFYLYLLITPEHPHSGRQFAVLGLILGFAITVHLNAVFPLLALLAAELWLWLAARNISSRLYFRRLLFFLLLIVAVLAFTELVTQGMAALIASRIGNKVPSFFEYLFFYVDENRAIRKTSFSNPLLFFFNIFASEGWPVLLFLIVGTGLAVKKIFTERATALFLLLTAYLVPALVFSIRVKSHDYLLQKGFQIGLAPALLLAAYGGACLLDFLSSRFPNRLIYRAAVGGVLVIILVVGLRHSLPVLEERYGYQEAIHQTILYVNHHGGKISAQPGPMLPQAVFYLGAERQSLKSPADLSFKREDPSDIYFVDHMGWGDKNAAIAAQVKNCSPIITVPYLSTANLPAWLDVFRRLTFTPHRQSPPNAIPIQVYDLRRCVPRPPLPNS